MNEILTYLIPALIGALPTGTLMYWTYNRKLKALEVKKEEVSTVSQTIDIWEKLYQESETERKELDSKVDEMRLLKDQAYQEVHDLKMEIAKKDLIIQDLTFKKCTRNNCPYRKPPRELGEEELPADADFSFIKDGQ